jgi:hypothetical protein
LREQHAAMSRVLGQSTASAAERATAYGDMGKLFVATELYDAAERCFSNARLLAPGDMRLALLPGARRATRQRSRQGRLVSSSRR